MGRYWLTRIFLDGHVVVRPPVGAACRLHPAIQRQPTCTARPPASRVRWAAGRRHHVRRAALQAHAMDTKTVSHGSCIESCA